VFANILAATDFSPGAHHARDVAIEWAVRARARLELVHVVSPMSRVFPFAGSWLTEDFTASLAQDVEGRMERELAEARARVPSATFALLHGTPHREIAARAESIGADLVVIGAAGASAMERPLFGSVADRVLRSATTPVLVVPTATRATHALPRVIVAPSDFSPASKDAVSRTATLARELGARIELVYAFEVPSFAAPDRPRGERRERALARELERTHSLGGIPVHVHVLDGIPAQVVARVVDETLGDLVAMASSGRGRVASLILGGVTDRVVRTSEVPVLVFPERR
jgi:nucleotide-binding universal stress UspA family protein